MNIHDLKQREILAKTWLNEAVKKSKDGRFTITGHSVDYILAKEILLRNENNRKLCLRHVQLLATAIHNGEWIETGDTIKVSADGRLIDGQHRLHAISRSLSPVTLDFAFGIDNGAQTRIDNNKVRQVGQQLSMAGKKNGNVMAASARMLQAVRQGLMKGDESMSKHAVIEFCLRDLLLESCAEEAAALAKTLGHLQAKAGICVGLYLVRSCKLADPILVGSFIKALETGANLHEHSPILALRNNLVRGSNLNSNQAPYEAAAWFCKAFVFYVRGTPCQKLIFSWGREKFPSLEAMLGNSVAAA